MKHRSDCRRYDGVYSNEDDRRCVTVNVIHVQRPSPVVEEVRRAIAADPCAVLGHRWAWLTAGGQECVQCGSRR